MTVYDTLREYELDELLTINRVVEFREQKDGRILKYTTFKEDSKGKYPLYEDYKMMYDYHWWQENNYE